VLKEWGDQGTWRGNNSFATFASSCTFDRLLASRAALASLGFPVLLIFQTWDSGACTNLLQSMNPTLPRLKLMSEGFEAHRIDIIQRDCDGIKEMGASVFC